MKCDFRKKLEDAVLQDYGNDFDKFMREEVLNTDYGTTRDFVSDLYHNHLYEEI